MTTMTMPILADVEETCPQGVPGCIGASDWHDPNYVVVHAIGNVRIPLTGEQWGWTASNNIKEPSESQHVEAWLTVDGDNVGSVNLALDGRTDGRYARQSGTATIDEAEALGRRLLEMVAVAREVQAREVQGR